MTVGIFEECLNSQTKAAGAKVDEILAQLSKEDSKSLLAALSDKSISANRISDVLRKRGITVGRDSIRSWRERNLSGDKA